MYSSILYLIYIGVIAYIIDIISPPKDRYKKCVNKLKFHIITLIHHIFNIYLQFGWLLNNLYLLIFYIFINLGTLLHWNSNNNYCFLTQLINKMCNIPINEYFRDIWYFLGIKNLKNYDILHYIYLIITLFISIYKIYSN
jgi:hypothetical protein